MEPLPRPSAGGGGGNRGAEPERPETEGVSPGSGQPRPDGHHPGGWVGWGYPCQQEARGAVGGRRSRCGESRVVTLTGPITPGLDPGTGEKPTAPTHPALGPAGQTPSLGRGGQQHLLRKRAIGDWWGVFYSLRKLTCAAAEVDPCSAPVFAGPFVLGMPNWLY